MFEHLDDPHPPTLDALVRQQIARRARRLRVRRRLVIAAPAVAAVIAAGVIIAQLTTTGRIHQVQTISPTTPTFPAGRVVAAMTVSPHTGLVGGQQIQVTVRGFPPHVTVGLSECASTQEVGPGGCKAPVYTGLYTDAAGMATGVFIAQPAAYGPTATASTVCHQQCVLVAVVTKVPGGVPHGATPIVTMPLSFSAAPVTSLADASLLDLTWVSSQDGWALADQPCTRGLCARVAHTTDGGQHWQALPDPPALVQSGTTDCTKTACVTNLRFASPTVGYLYGPALLITTDGGRSWQRQPGPAVETLEADGPQVFRVTYTGSGCPGPCDRAVQVAPVGSTTWRTVLSGATGPSDNVSSQIVASGATVYLAIYGNLAKGAQQAIIYRSLDGGQSWHPLPDPCKVQAPPLHVLTELAAAPGDFVAGLCSSPAASGVYLVTSADRGSHWQPGRQIPGPDYLGALAAASSSRLAVASGATGGGGPDIAQLFVSTDGGAHWTTPATDSQQINQSVPAWLGFETPQVGRWIGDPHSIWTTHDGGLHWIQTRFQ